MLSGLGLLTALTVYHQFEQTNYNYSCCYCRLLHAKYTARKTVKYLFPNN